MAKPIPEHVFYRHLKEIGWPMTKGHIDYNLYDEKGIWLCTVQIAHGGGRKREVTARSVHKVEKICKQRGIQWPPRKK